MGKITIVDGQFVYEGRAFAPASALVAYPGEQVGLGVVAGSEQVCRKTPREIDLLFAVGEKVAGCEVKLPEDLVGSWYSKRLARQLRTLRSVVDVWVLVLRGGINPEMIEEALFELRKRLSPTQRKRTYKFWEDLVNIQTLGVYILPVPYTNYLPRINDLRRALATNGMRAVAGTDQVERERQPGWLLRRIPGIGPMLSGRLLAKYGRDYPATPVYGVFVAALEGWVTKDFGPTVQQKVLQALKE